MASPSGSQPASSSFVETVKLEHVPSTYTVLLGLFKDVTNAEFLQQQLLSRNAEYEYAFIDASSVCPSPLKLLYISRRLLSFPKIGV